MQKFETDYNKIIERIKNIDPVIYARTRNSLDGDVSYISRYLTHGVVSLKLVKDITNKISNTNLENKNYSDNIKYEKWNQELAWREYFHRVWQSLGDDIFSSIRQDQSNVKHASGIPISFANLSSYSKIEEVKKDNKESGKENSELDSTGVKSLDRNIEKLIETGYMHNHARMWTSMLATNIAGYAWSDCSRWMYYHLIDGDLASNTLSWQWICSTFSAKQYVANQENINKYDRDNAQRKTYLDCEYEDLYDAVLPESMIASFDIQKYFDDDFELDTQALNKYSIGNILKDKNKEGENENKKEENKLELEQVLNFENNFDKNKNTIIYSMWNLDPTWYEDKGDNINRILFIEKSALKDFPMSTKRIEFVLEITKNISDKYKNFQILYGEINELEGLVTKDKLDNSISREYPLCNHWGNLVEDREWLYPNYSWSSGGFMSFWSKVNGR